MSSSSCRVSLFLLVVVVVYRSYGFVGTMIGCRISSLSPCVSAPYMKKKTSQPYMKKLSDDNSRWSGSAMMDDILRSIDEDSHSFAKNISRIGPARNKSDIIFPELEQSGIDERALRKSPFGKVLFGVLDRLFPVFSEPNWFDLYDPPLSPDENLALPYFDGYDFVNSSWTIYVRHRYGVWNWLDRLGLVPQATQRVFLRGDGKTMWSDGFYGEWYINPAINYFQLEKHFGRGFGYLQYQRGIRIYQIQKWNFETEVGRYWNRGLRSYLRNETNYFAIEGRVWGVATKWRPYPRDQGKFIAIRDGTNLTAVFGSSELETAPWQKRFEHAMSLPFYQAHPDQLERIEDNFEMLYRNLLGKEVR